MKKITREDALAYHTVENDHGKIEVVPTKPCLTQRDLSLAYTPGVAEPCLEIERDPELAYDYTTKGNLVAVVTNGTAVLGLGNIGALAGKPVMEGKGVLFKRFADIDVFDIEVDEQGSRRRSSQSCELLEPTFGGINLEDIKAPECFEIEETLKRASTSRCSTTTSTARRSSPAPALLNALEIVGKKHRGAPGGLSRAPAPRRSPARNTYVRLGVTPREHHHVRLQGGHLQGPHRGHERVQGAFAVDTDARTLADALKGADCLRRALGGEHR